MVSAENVEIKREYKEVKDMYSKIKIEQAVTPQPQAHEAKSETRVSRVGIRDRSISTNIRPNNLINRS